MAPAPSIHLGGGESGSQRGTGRACWTVKAVATIVQLKSAGPVVRGFKHFLVCSISWGFSPRRDVSLALQITNLSLCWMPLSHALLFVKRSFSVAIGSVQFSCSVVSDCLQLHGLQDAKLPCPSPTPGAYSTACPLSQRCHPTISSSVVPFSSCLQSFPATSGGQSIGVSALASVLPMNIQS